MESNFESALIVASKQLLDEAYSQYEHSVATRTFVEPNSAQISDLGHRILALPDDDIAMLLLHYVFGFSYIDISKLLKQDMVKGKIRFTKQLISGGMALAEHEIINDNSMNSACKIALKEYAKDDVADIQPTYTRGFIRKMQRLNLVKGRPNLVVNILQKVAIVFIVMGISFGTALGVSAEFRETVYRWFIETFPQFSEFRLNADSNNAEQSYERLQRYRPNYIPDGYIAQSVENFYPSVYFDLFNTEGYVLTITGSLPDGSVIALNTEDVNIQKTIFNEEDAYYWEKYGHSYFVFVLDGYQFNIIGQLDMDEVVKIAENIKIEK